MRAREVIGRRVVHVEPAWAYNAAEGRTEAGVAFVELEGGVRLFPVAVRLEGGDLVDLVVVKPKRGRGRPPKVATVAARARAAREAELELEEPPAEEESEEEPAAAHCPVTGEPLG